MSETVKYRRFAVNVLSPALAQEVHRVDEIAVGRVKYMNGASAEILQVHKYGAQSKGIQDLLAPYLSGTHGAIEEKNLSTPPGITTRSRPDFILRLAEGRGVLVEVERGGTVSNNHDLKDFWKAHLSRDTHHLFLAVPIHNFRRDGTVRESPFERVANRFGSFFGDGRREVDVLTLHLFGY